MGVIVGNKKPTGQANKGELGWVASIVLIEKLAFLSMQCVSIETEVNYYFYF